MSFRRDPVTEQAPQCMVCHVTVYSGDLICSATCSDLWSMWDRTSEIMELENDCT